MSARRKLADPTFRRLLRDISQQKTLFLLIILTAIISNLIVLFGPRLVGEAIDQMLGPDEILWQPLLRILLILLILFVFGSIAQWGLNQITTVLAARIVRDYRQRGFSAISRQPLSRLDRHSHGDLVNRLTYDLDAIMDGLLTGLSQAFTGLVTLIGSLIFMLLIEPGITVLVLALMPFSFGLAGLIANRSRQKFREQSEISGRLNGLAEEMTEHMDVVQAFQAQKRQVERYDQINADLYTTGQKAQFYSSMTNPTTRLINHIAYVSVALLSSLMAIRGRLSIGQLASFLGYVSQFARPINEITGMAAQLQSAIASARRVYDLIDMEPEQDDCGLPLLQVTDGHIRFGDVTFSYHPGQQLIRNLNLDIRAGQMVAIVGPTGAGKTTLVNLLMRFYELNDGQIQIDGQDISAVNRDSLRTSFGMVLQDSWLFTGSVRDNIAFGRPDASLADIEAAAIASHAHAFIRRLPDGYDTWIGRGHTHLSQGQQQLLTIARAFLVAPPLLILDEATSSVDTHTEVQIQMALRRLMQGKTSFIIAHRLSTIREADLILVMRDGQVIEQGRHETLMAGDTFYRKLLQSQFAGQDMI